MLISSLNQLLGEKMKGRRYYPAKPFLLGCCFLFVLLSCSSDDIEIKQLSIALNEAALKIDNDFFRIRQQTVLLAGELKRLYSPDNIMKTLTRVDRTRYHLAENGVMYKPVNDGKSAVFVSGYVPINDEIKEIVYFTEPIETELKRITDQFPEVIQAYYNDQYSYNRIYPFFDVLSQYEPKMNIPAFNFYYLANEEYNPEKKGVWVNDPYVDPAGRGWMISAIAPVYVNDQLEGVAGLDVTISTITDRYTKALEGSYIILDAEGLVVSINESLTGLLGLPRLQEHAYLETVKQDTFRSDHFNLLNSKSKSVRQGMNEIYYDGKSMVSFAHGDEEITILSAKINELNWYIMLVVKE